MKFSKTVFPLLLASALLAPASFAGTIATNFDGVGAATNAQTPGQKVTTPDGGPWNNIIFNFYDGEGNPYALGDLYLLTSPYTGTPQALSDTAAGFVADVTASDDEWVFDSDLSLDADTDYYFYMTSHPPSATVATTTGSGGYGSANGTANFASRPFDQQYTLQGTSEADTPEPAAGLLLCSGLALVGIAAKKRSCIR